MLLLQKNYFQGSQVLLYSLPRKIISSLNPISRSRFASSAFKAAITPFTSSCSDRHQKRNQNQLQGAPLTFKTKNIHEFCKNFKIEKYSRKITIGLWSQSRDLLPYPLLSFQHSLMKGLTLSQRTKKSIKIALFVN